MAGEDHESPHLLDGQPLPHPAPSHRYWKHAAPPSFKKKRGKKLRRTKELGPHEQEHAGGPSWAWLRPWLAASRPPLPCPGRVSWGGKESPQPCGWLGLQAEMPEALQVCSGLWGSHGLALCTPDHCSALWPPQGRQGAPCRAGPTVDLGLETARPGRT